MKDTKAGRRGRDGKKVVPLGIEVSDEHYRLLQEVCSIGRWTKRVAVELAIKSFREKVKPADE